MQRIPISDVLHATEQRLRGLMLQALAGDEKAYRSFLQAAAPHLRAFLRRRMSRWPDEVEDVVQECLLAMSALVGFIVVHLVMVALVPRTLLAMLRGR